MTCDRSVIFSGYSNTIDRHDIAKILLKVGLNTITLTLDIEKSAFWFFFQIAGVMTSVVENNPDGTFDIDIMKQRIRQINDPHFPYTRLICLENTHNFCGGKVIPLSFMEEVLYVSQFIDAIL